jgi:hypothetical protein
MLVDNYFERLILFVRKSYAISPKWKSVILNIYGLFNKALSTSDYIASKYRVINEKLMINYMEESNHCLINVSTIPAFS